MIMMAGGEKERAGSVEDFLKQLESFEVVRCDAAAIRILGLSPAGWNAIFSVGLAGLATLGMVKKI